MCTNTFFYRYLDTIYMRLFTQTKHIQFKGFIYDPEKESNSSPFWDTSHRECIYHDDQKFLSSRKTINLSHNIAFLDAELQKRIWLFMVDLRSMYVNYAKQNGSPNAIDILGESLAMSLSKITANIPSLPRSMTDEETKCLYDNFSILFKQNKVLKESYLRWNTIKHDTLYKFLIRFHLQNTYHVYASIRNKYFNGNLIMLGIFLYMEELFTLDSDQKPAIKPRYRGKTFLFSF